jgi:hypothetical protein
MSGLYDHDFYAWAAEQAELLRAGRLSEADVANIAEEIESLGRREKRELTECLAALLVHLLQWRCQPDRRDRSLAVSVREQRRQAGRLLRDNPSLRPQLSDIVGDAYGDAILAAERETGLPESAFPSVCPWTAGQALDDAFMPE